MAQDANAAEARQRLVVDQRSYFWLRFEKEGFRIYLTGEVLPVLRFPLQEDLHERVYMQACADGDVMIYSVNGYLAQYGSAPITQG